MHITDTILELVNSFFFQYQSYYDNNDLNKTQ